MLRHVIRGHPLPWAPLPIFLAGATIPSTVTAKAVPPQGGRTRANEGERGWGHWHRVTNLLAGPALEDVHVEGTISIGPAVAIGLLLLVDRNRNDDVQPMVECAGDVDQRNRETVLVADVQACNEMESLSTCTHTTMGWERPAIETD